MWHCAWAAALREELAQTVERACPRSRRPRCSCSSRPIRRGSRCSRAALEADARATALAGVAHELLGASVWLARDLGKRSSSRRIRPSRARARTSSAARSGACARGSTLSDRFEQLLASSPPPAAAGAGPGGPPPPPLGDSANSAVSPASPSPPMPPASALAAKAATSAALDRHLWMPPPLDVASVRAALFENIDAKRHAPNAPVLAALIDRLGAPGGIGSALRASTAQLLVAGDVLGIRPANAPSATLSPPLGILAMLQQDATGASDARRLLSVLVMRLSTHADGRGYLLSAVAGTPSSIWKGPASSDDAAENAPSEGLDLASVLLQAVCCTGRSWDAEPTAEDALCAAILANMTLETDACARLADLGAISVLARRVSELSSNDAKPQLLSEDAPTPFAVPAETRPPSRPRDASAEAPAPSSSTRRAPVGGEPRSAAPAPSPPAAPLPPRARARATHPSLEADGGDDARESAEAGDGRRELALQRRRLVATHTAVALFNICACPAAQQWFATSCESGGPAADGAALPAGWITGTDPTSGAQYFYSLASGESQWHAPEGADPAEALRSLVLALRASWRWPDSREPEFQFHAVGSIFCLLAHPAARERARADGVDSAVLQSIDEWDRLHEVLPARSDASPRVLAEPPAPSIGRRRRHRLRACTFATRALRAHDSASSSTRRR